MKKQIIKIIAIIIASQVAAYVYFLINGTNLYLELFIFSIIFSALLIFFKRK